MKPFELEKCLKSAAAALLSRRNPHGYWEGRLASSPLATAVALCALGDGELDAGKRHKAFEYLAATQNSDGGWGDTEISKSNLAATLLVLCADANPTRPSTPLPASVTDVRERTPEGSGVGSDRRRHAQAFTEKLGGLREGLRRVYSHDLTFQVPIRMTAASAGLLPWREVDALPFELALAPRSLMGALRLPVVSYALPALVSVGLARHGRAPSWLLPLRWLREALADRALELILKMQPESGGYLEAIPITAFCLLGLKAAGREDHPVARHAQRFLLAAQRADGSWPVEINLSVWNTTRAIETLATAGMLESALSAQERATTRDWLLSQQTKGVSVYSDARPGGWGWNHLSGSVPDADDTAGAVLALRRLGVAADDAALLAAQKWLLQLQNRDGGWPTFCRGWGKLPFDRSAADLTAHAVRALKSLQASGSCATGSLAVGCPCEDATEAGWLYLRRVQRPDGSFAPLWFGCETAPDQANATYGTCHVLLACRGFRQVQALRDRALSWLRGVQNSDGGLGGCTGAPSTAEETGLALHALAAHGGGFQDEGCQRAARWLVERQRSDGSWNPAPIGFYFAVLWYYEELYPLHYALGGLGALGCTAKENGSADC